MADKQAEVMRPRVDPRDEPSAEWGWHGEFPGVVQVMGWTIAIVLLLMLIGNHKGNIENVVLIGMSLTIMGALVLDLRRRRLSWRR